VRGGNLVSDLRYPSPRGILVVDAQEEQLHLVLVETRNYIALNLVDCEHGFVRRDWRGISFWHDQL